MYLFRSVLTRTTAVPFADRSSDGTRNQANRKHKQEPKTTSSLSSFFSNNLAAITAGALPIPCVAQHTPAIMSEEAKTAQYPVKADVHADTYPAVNKFNQSEDPIPKVVPPRGSKDARSFRPSTLAEINMMNRYEPLELKIGDKTYGIGCGNSLEDVLLICGCILALWSFVLGVSGLLLKSAIDTDRCVLIVLLCVFD